MKTKSGISPQALRTMASGEWNLFFRLDTHWHYIWGLDPVSFHVRQLAEEVTRTLRYIIWQGCSLSWQVQLVCILHPGPQPCLPRYLLKWWTNMHISLAHCQNRLNHLFRWWNFTHFLFWSANTENIGYHTLHERVETLVICWPLQ